MKEAKVLLQWLLSHPGVAIQARLRPHSIEPKVGGDSCMHAEPVTMLQFCDVRCTPPRTTSMAASERTLLHSLKLIVERVSSGAIEASNSHGNKRGDEGSERRSCYRHAEACTCTYGEEDRSREKVCHDEEAAAKGGLLKHEQVRR